MDNKERASCLAVHDKFIAVGCDSGRIYIYDIDGNELIEWVRRFNAFIDSITRTAYVLQRARHHKCAVNCISVDAPGAYIVSCANDSTASIFGIGLQEYNQVIRRMFPSKIEAFRRLI